MKHRLLSALGICRKAGKLTMGFDPVAEDVRKREAFLVMTARDLSPKSCKEIMLIVEQENTEHCALPVTMDELWFQLGKRVGILAVTDRGLAGMVKDAVVRANEEE